MQELVFFRKVLLGFKFASVNFSHNMQGFKFGKKKKKEMGCTCFSRHMTTLITLFVLINAGQIFAGLMFAGLMFANFL